MSEKADFVFVPRSQNVDLPNDRRESASSASSFGSLTEGYSASGGIANDRHSLSSTESLNDSLAKSGKEQKAGKAAVIPDCPGISIVNPKPTRSGQLTSCDDWLKNSCLSLNDECSAIGEIADDRQSISSNESLYDSLEKRFKEENSRKAAGIPDCPGTSKRHCDIVNPKNTSSGQQAYYSQKLFVVDSSTKALNDGNSRDILKDPVLEMVQKQKFCVNPRCAGTCGPKCANSTDWFHDHPRSINDDCSGTGGTADRHSSPSANESVGQSLAKSCEIADETNSVGLTLYEDWFHDHPISLNDECSAIGEKADDRQSLSSNESLYESLANSAKEQKARKAAGIPDSPGTSIRYCDIVNPKNTSSGQQANYSQRLFIEDSSTKALDDGNSRDILKDPVLEMVQKPKFCMNPLCAGTCGPKCANSSDWFHDHPRSINDDCSGTCGTADRQSFPSANEFVCQSLAKSCKIADETNSVGLIRNDDSLHDRPISLNDECIAIGAIADDRQSLSSNEYDSLEKSFKEQKAMKAVGILDSPGTSIHHCDIINPKPTRSGQQANYSQRLFKEDSSTKVLDDGNSSDILEDPVLAMVQKPKACGNPRCAGKCGPKCATSSDDWFHDRPESLNDCCRGTGEIADRQSLPSANEFISQSLAKSGKIADGTNSVVSTPYADWFHDRFGFVPPNDEGRAIGEIADDRQSLPSANEALDDMNSSYIIEDPFIEIFRKRKSCRNPRCVNGCERCADRST